MFADRFFVGATFIIGTGWKVNIASVREGDDGLNLKSNKQLAAMNIKVNQRKEKDRLCRERKEKGNGCPTAEDDEGKIRNP